MLAKLERRSRTSAEGSLTDPSAWAERMFGGGGATASGVEVTRDSVLSATAVYAGVRLYMETMGSVPLKTMRRRVPGPGRDVATDHPLYTLLHDQPNPEQTAMEFREMLTFWMVMTQNGYAEIVRDGSGHVAELWPIPSYRVRMERIPETGRLRYRVNLPNGGQPIIPFENMLHIRGFSRNGLVGDDTIAMLRESFGLTLAADESAARFFGNGALPAGHIEHPGKIKDGGKNLRESWTRVHGGLANAHRVAVLEEGAKFVQDMLDPEKAQLLGAREFQIAEVARILNLPPHLLRDLTRSTNNNIEHQGIEFVTISIRPWAVRYEQAFARCLLTPTEKKTIYFMHQLDGLMRGDLPSRTDALAVQRNNGIINADEWRELEDMNPQPNGQGQVYLVPLNMIPADQAQHPRRFPPSVPPAAEPTT
jgi:HK97 family phage portal protein